MRFSILSVSFYLLLASTALAAESSTVQWQGSGCPKAQADIQLIGDSAEIQHDTAKDFRVTRGPKVSLRDSRKNCQALIDLKVPAGKQFALESISLSGERPVEKGKNDRVDLRADLSYQGKGTTATISLPLPDGAEKTFKLDHKVSETERFWSGCGPARALLVNIQGRISGTEAKDAEASVHKIILGLRLKKCD